MGYVFDGQNRRITLTPGTTQVDIEDLYSRWVDWARTGVNARFLPAFRNTGKEPDGAGGFTGSYIFMMNGWSIVPQSANHTLVLSGNLFRDPQDTSGTPLVSSVAGFTISVILARSSLAQGVATGGGGGGGASFTVADIWNYDVDGAIGVGRMIRRIAKILGLTSASVTASDAARTTSDGDINQTITSNPGGSRTMSGSP